MIIKIADWKCVLKGNKIQVYHSGRYEGDYALLLEPYCNRCSMPGVVEDKCTWHWNLDNSLTRIYSVGEYLSSKDKNSLLTDHLNHVKKDREYAIPLGMAITLKIKYFYKELMKSDCIVPVPLHKNTLKKRKFNQVEEIAKIICEKLNMPLLQPLKKIKDVKSHTLGRTERVEHSKGAYLCIEKLLDNSVLLVDDTSTSGSTLSECSKVLHSNGAKTINAIVGGKTKLRYQKS